MILTGDEWPEAIPEPDDDGDPISWPCEECGADAGEECRPGCIAVDGAG